MKTPRIAVLSLLSALVITGCASQGATNPEPVEETEAVAENPAWERLRELAVEARDEIRLLSKAQQAENAESLSDEQKEQRAYQSTHVPDGFDEVVSFRHTGPAVQAAEAIARLADYEVEVTGGEPEHEIIVGIEIEDRALIEALHELGAQTGDRVRVEVYESDSLIRFIYQ